MAWSYDSNGYNLFGVKNPGILPLISQPVIIQQPINIQPPPGTYNMPPNMVYEPYKSPTPIIDAIFGSPCTSVPSSGRWVYRK